MCILTWDHLQINPVVKCVKELLLETTVHFVVEGVDSNVTKNAEKLPLHSLWRFQEITFRLGNAWLVYNNLSLIIAWIRMHCRHFPSLHCQMNRSRIYTIYKTTIMAKLQMKGRNVGSAGLIN